VSARRAGGRRARLVEKRHVVRETWH
jgi:hypothetical protein